MTKKLQGSYKFIETPETEDQLKKAYDFLFDKVMEKRKSRAGDTKLQAQLTPEEDLLLDSLVDRAIEELSEEKVK